MTDRRDITRPEPGWWAIRLVKNGPLVGAAIVRVHPFDPWFPTNILDRSPYLVGYIGTEIVKPSEVWERKGKSITEAEYNFLVADAQWASRHAQSEPAANPKQRVDLAAMPVILPP